MSGSNEVETCQLAMEAAFEKGIGFCETKEARIEVLSQVVGLNGDDIDFDTEAVLDNGPGAGSGSIQTRQWVLARADEIIGDGTDEPLDAVNQAWSEAADEMVESSSDDEDGGEAEESGADGAEDDEADVDIPAPEEDMGDDDDG